MNGVKPPKQLPRILTERKSYKNRTKTPEKRLSYKCRPKKMRSQTSSPIMQTLVRLALFALCATAGYLTARSFVPSGDTTKKIERPAAVVNEPLVPATAAESTFIAEWEQLRGSSGDGGEALPAIYSDVKDIKDAFRRRAFRSALLAEWAVSNPQAALAYLSEKDTGMITQLLREWLRIDANGAITAMLAGGEKQRGNLRSVLSEIAKLAPERLADVISALPKSQSRWDSTALEAFSQFAQKDPEAARRAAESVTGPLRGQALAGVARTWAEKEGEAALKWGQAMPPGEDRDAVLKAVLTGWAKTDPLAALDRIDLVPPGAEENYYGSDVGAQVLREAGKKDWDGTLEWLRDHPGKLGRTSLDGLRDALSHRLAVDPTGTLRTLSASGVPGIDNVLANSLLNEGYAQRDTIWQWIGQQPPSEFSKSARGWVINATAWKEPMAALTLLDQLPDNEENKTVLERGAGSMINGGSQMHRFEEFMEAASPKIREHLLAAAFMYGMHQSVSEPERWVKRIDELPEEKRTNAVQSLARGWAMTDPAAAMNWAMSFPEGPKRDAAFEPVMGAWAQNDTYEVSQWIEAQPQGKTRDRATRGLVGALIESQPETAWSWAMTIGAEGTRLSALQLAYMGMRQKNPKAADQLLESSNLPPQHLEALRKMQPSAFAN
jgi:hypothetical protein